MLNFRPQWSRDITSTQWHALFAAQADWMLAAMDVLLFAFAAMLCFRQFLN